MGLDSLFLVLIAGKIPFVPGFMGLGGLFDISAVLVGRVIVIVVFVVVVIVLLQFCFPL